MTTNRQIEFQVWPGVLLLGMSVLFMGVAAALFWPAPEIAFASDQSPVSWLSSAQLWAIALLALRLAMEGSLPRGVGIWLSSAMIVLAMDEQFTLHELWKYNCPQWFSACAKSWVTDMPTLALGFWGIASAAVLHRSLPPGWARVQLWTSITIGCVALQTDLLGTLHAVAPYEEALEVLAEVLFTGILLGLRREEIQVHQP